jgi:hypothetical protein
MQKKLEVIGEEVAESMPLEADVNTAEAEEFDFADYMEETVRIPCYVEGKVFHVFHRVHSRTLAYQMRLETLNADLEAKRISHGDFVKEVYLPLISGWDMKKKGEPIPFSLEALLGMPDAVFQAIASALLTAVNVPKS